MSEPFIEDMHMFYNFESKKWNIIMVDITFMKMYKWAPKVG